MKLTTFMLMMVLTCVAMGVRGADAAEAAAAVRTALEEGKALEGPVEWDTTMSLGGSLTRGNSETMVANARLATEKLIGTELFKASLEGAYGEAKQENEAGETSTEKNVENATLTLGYKHRFEGFFVTADGILVSDSIADVDYRGIPSVGIGTFLMDSEDVRISVQSGLGYLWEKVSGETDSYTTYCLSERTRFGISETSSIWEEVAFIGSMEDSSDTLWTAEVGADAAMNATMKLGVVLKYTYDNTPAEESEKDDLSLTAQISFKL